MSSDTPDSTRLVDELARLLPAGTVHRPGTEQYAQSTSPDNSSFRQRPDAVVRPRACDDVATAVTLARALGLRVGVQATGHGAGSPLDGGLVLVDTSALDAVSIDPRTRTARVGAGVTWSKVQAQAEIHGLLALSGTSPTVGVSGYTFNGGVGWLVRPFGLASSSLRTVEYVDGVGRVHRISDESDESTDAVEREALWAFRGGAPVGIATELEFDLFPVSELWAGYLLWPAEHLTALAAAWTAALEQAPDTLTSTLALLRLPPGGPFPEALLNTTVVHLSYASTSGRQGLAALREAMRTVAEPAVDTTGPSDAATLSGIHLDPPAAVPARGLGRWHGRAAPSFREGQPDPADAYTEPELRRLTEVAAHTDPDRVFAFQRVPARPPSPEIVLP